VIILAITAAMIKELREVSGVGMQDCKNALTEADGNMEKAVEILREKGLATATKKAGRIASEGLVYTYVDESNKNGVIVEVNSETDFVAKNEEFQKFVHNVAVQAAVSKATGMDELMAETWKQDAGMTVKDALVQKISVIGENLSIRRFDRYTVENGAIISYIHGGGRVAVLLELESSVVNDALSECGKNLCMQIAAMNPRFVSKDNVPADFIEKEKEILTQQAKNDEKNKNKPDNILEKMVLGRLEKELKEFCLLSQEYVKDSEMNVAKYVETVGKEIGSEIVVKRFVRYETGEGIEKKEENFAEEVSKAMGKQ